MWIVHELTALSPGIPTHLVIGAFDGIHRGHQALMREMATAAQAAGAQAVVLTFDPLPRQFFNHNPANTQISSLDERLELLATLGLDGVVIQPFTHAVATLSARAFLTWVQQHLRVTDLWAGPDFALGRARDGTLEVLHRLGAELGFVVRPFAPFIWRGAAVHSSDIRQLLTDGRIEAANALLGRPYRLAGVVSHGEQRGRQMGFPTANLAVPPERLLPQHGIYVCQAHLARGVFDAVTNIGTRPTFDHSDTTIEAYLLDFEADIYGEPLRLDFLTRLRPELRFASAAALIAQMRADVVRARDWLAAHRAGESGALDELP